LTLHRGLQEFGFLSYKNKHIKIFGNVNYYNDLYIQTKTDIQMKKIKLNFSTIRTIENTLYKNVSRIIINGGGGMGGSREEIRGKIVSYKTEPHGFMVVQDIITDELIEINPKFIGSISKINVTKLYFEHDNSNFPSGRRTEFFSHRINTEIEFTKDDGIGERMEKSQKDFSLNLNLFHTDDMNYI
jgi:hypothetical protein